MLRLYSYFRSSASYRVRIALKLKGLDYQAVPVHLLRGEQRTPSYLEVNPAGLVPVLDADGQVFTQSLAIIEYLDEIHPQPSLLPGRPVDRARIRAIALSVACDIHPLNNLSVIAYLKDVLEVDEETKVTWYRHWVEKGLATVERLLADDPRTGLFCHGATPTLADCCLVPQVFNALRFDCPVAHLPTIRRIYDCCLALDAFQQAAPGNQPDALENSHG